MRADEALALGLVDRVVPADEVYAQAHAWAAKLAQGPAIALRAAKESIDTVWRRTSTPASPSNELVRGSVRHRGP
ncbi:hypothetical protein GCM10023238_14260 [Streptomyces heliomycini]